MSESKGKKRSKSYYIRCAKKQQHHTNHLQPGYRGFLVTYNNNEKQCIRETYQLLNYYGDKYFGPEKVQIYWLAFLTSTTDVIFNVVVHTLRTRGNGLITQVTPWILKTNLNKKLKTWKTPQKLNDDSKPCNQEPRIAFLLRRQYVIASCFNYPDNSSHLLSSYVLDTWSVWFCT